MSTGLPDFWTRAYYELIMNFLELKDTPGSYLGQAHKIPMVNAEESGLEFEDYPTLAEHKVLHQAGGGAEINVEALSGVLTDKQHVIISEVINLVYPIGSIYTSIVSTNPGTLFGVGTWVAFGVGRVLVGLDAGQTEFDVVEEQGGAKTVSIAHIHDLSNHVHGTPSHTHNLSNHVHGVLLPEETWVGGGRGEGGREFTESVDIRTAQKNINSGVPGPNVSDAGGVDNTGVPAPNLSGQMSANETPSILQPYIVVYMWKRTA